MEKGITTDMTTDINANNTAGQRLTIRVGRSSLSFAAIKMESGEGRVVFEPYTVRSGVSLAANLREAFKTADLPTAGYRKALVLVDAPALLVPVDAYDESSSAAMYAYTFPHSTATVTVADALPDLNAVAVFGVNKDLKLVIDDHFADVKFGIAMGPVWRYLYRRSFTGMRGKLYGYFHNRKLELFRFGKNRFKFCNTFDVDNAHDAAYFLLCVWKQLGMDAEGDELFLVGDMPEKEWLVDEMKSYLHRVYVVNPAGDFNRAPVTQIKGMPYDLMTYFVKGR